jgi:hypothetical protein
VYSFEAAERTSHPLVKRVFATEPTATLNGNREHFEHLIVNLLELAEEHSEPGAIISALVACVPDYVPQERPATRRSMVAV